MSFDLNEISDHKKFEDLVVSYFEDLKNEKGQNIVDVVVKPSGTGTDGGRDILVTLKMTDSLVVVARQQLSNCFSPLHKAFRLITKTINHLQGYKNQNANVSAGVLNLAPPNILFSNQFQEDLRRIHDLSRFIDISIPCTEENRNRVFPQ